MNTLRRIYIERYRVAPRLVEQALLARMLYPHARVVRALMPPTVRRLSFDLDLEFVRAVGQLRHRREFRGMCSEFLRDPGNFRFARRVLRLRVSGERAWQVVEDLLGATESQPPR